MGTVDSRATIVKVPGYLELLGLWVAGAVCI
jgi:hypothetical protein